MSVTYVLEKWVRFEEEDQNASVSPPIYNFYASGNEKDGGNMSFNSLEDLGEFIQTAASDSQYYSDTQSTVFPVSEYQAYGTINPKTKYPDYNYELWIPEDDNSRGIYWAYVLIKITQIQDIPFKVNIMKDNIIANKLKFKNGNKWTSLLDLCYPVGTYLYWTNSSTTPASALGGTWTKDSITQGRYTTTSASALTTNTITETFYHTTGSGRYYDYYDSSHSDIYVEWANFAYTPINTPTVNIVDNDGTGGYILDGNGIYLIDYDGSFGYELEYKVTYQYQSSQKDTATVTTGTFTATAGSTIVIPANVMSAQGFLSGPYETLTSSDSWSHSHAAYSSTHGFQKYISRSGTDVASTHVKKTTSGTRWVSASSTTGTCDLFSTDTEEGIVHQHSMPQEIAAANAAAGHTHTTNWSNTAFSLTASQSYPLISHYMQLYRRVG